MGIPTRELIPRPQAIGGLQRVDAPQRASSAFVLRWVAILTLFGAEAIHVSVIEDHFYDWFAAGVFFWSVAALEGLIGAGLMFFPTRRLYAAAAVLSVATVAVWVLSRTVGLPFGPSPWIPESVGIPDAISSLFETVTAVAVRPLIVAGRTSLPADRARHHYVAVALLSVPIALLTNMAIDSAAEAPYGHGERQAIGSWEGDVEPRPRR